MGASLLLRNKRVFIVEDHPGNLAIIRWILEHHGAKTEFEPWGVATIPKLRKFAPVDIILLDLMFPNKVTGYDIFDVIQETGEFSDIPIVAVSASDPQEAIHKTKSHGFAGFIAKPLDFDKFPDQVQTILDGESIWHTG